MLPVARTACDQYRVFLPSCRVQDHLACGMGTQAVLACMQ